MAQKRKSKKTKKIGVAGKFGPRYGRKIRENVRKIEEKAKAKHKCPQCGKASFKRISTGVWECTKCKTKAAGGAYVPQTGLGKISQRAVQGATREEMLAAFAEEEEVEEEPKKAAKPKKRRAAKKPKKESTEELEPEQAEEAEPEPEPEAEPEKEPAPESDEPEPEPETEEPAPESEPEPIDEAEPVKPEEAE